MKCEEYKIIYGPTIEKLTLKVNTLLNKGFTLVGGVSYMCDNGWYIQAMCKIKKE